MIFISLSIIFIRNEQIKLILTSDEALVLFEFLGRFSDKNILKIEDQGEERALWNLYCLLESELVEPFSDKYEKLVKEARDRLRDEV